MYFGVIAVAADLTGGLAAYKAIRESGREVSLVFKTSEQISLSASKAMRRLRVRMVRRLRPLWRKCRSQERQNMKVNVVARVELLGEEVVGRSNLRFPVELAKAIENHLRVPFRRTTRLIDAVFCPFSKLVS